MQFRQRFRELRREQGLGAALRYAARAVGRLVVLREPLILAGRDLDGDWPRIPLPEGHERVDLRPEDLPHLVRDLSLDAEKEMLFGRRLEEGVSGMGTRGPDGSFVYVTWFGWGACPDPESPYLPDLADDEALLFDSYTRPDARKKGLHKAMNVRRLEALRSLGFRRVCVLFVADNVGAQKAQERSGLMPLRRIDRTRVLGIWFVRTRSLPGSDHALKSR